MKRLFSTLLKVRKELNVALAISIGLYVFVKVWQHNLPPVLRWGGVDLLSNLSLAMVASWVFFFIGDHWNKNEQAEFIQSYLKKTLHHIGTELDSIGTECSNLLENSSEPWFVDEFVVTLNHAHNLCQGVLRHDIHLPQKVLNRNLNAASDLEKFNTRIQIQPILTTEEMNELKLSCGSHPSRMHETAEKLWYYLDERYERVRSVLP